MWPRNKTEVILSFLSPGYVSPLSHLWVFYCFIFHPCPESTHCLVSRIRVAEVYSQWLTNNKVNVCFILKKLRLQQVKLSFSFVFMALIECQRVTDLCCQSCLTLIATCNLWHSIKTGNKAKNGSICMFSQCEPSKRIPKGFQICHNPYSLAHRH